jgi:hypothetical protein
MATFDAVKNFGKVTVSTGYDDSAVSIVLSGGHGAKLPDPSSDGEFNLVWWNNTDYGDPSDDPNVEIVRCTARSTDTLTVTRNQEGSGASIKNIASKTYRMALVLTKKMMDDLTDAAGKKMFGINVFDSSQDVAVGDGAVAIPVPADFNGYELKDVLCTVHTKGITGTTDVQVRRRRAGADVDMLSTKVTIGDEFYANDEVINAANDDIATGDEIYIDVDAVHSGTAPKGLSVILTFE